MHEIHVLLTIAYRDFIKLLRDRPRLVIGFVFPFLFIGILGGALEANIGSALGYNFLTFVFTGVLAQTLFQSTASGVISLIEDRENDFSQEIFVSPVSRYTIIGGKILGETLVSLVQAAGILLFGVVLGVPMSAGILLQLIPAILMACLLGGAFGVVVMANLSSQRTANQVFPLVLFPQFFLAGVFNPVKELPWYLDILSRLAPMRYAVDLLRNFYYIGDPVAEKVLLMPMWTNLMVVGGMFVVFLGVGTWMFVRSERNR